MSKIIELCPSVLCNGAEYETDFSNRIPGIIKCIENRRIKERIQQHLQNKSQDDYDTVKVFVTGHASIGKTTSLPPCYV